MEALAAPEPTPGRRTDLLKISGGERVDSGELSRARAICKWAPEWIDEILDAGGAFAKAFAVADARRSCGGKLFPVHAFVPPARPRRPGGLGR
jgi:hypothetical protein